MNVISNAGMKPGTEDVIGGAGTESVVGCMISDAGRKPSTGDVIGDAQSGIEDVKAAENMNSNVRTQSTKGDIIQDMLRKAGAVPGMENVTGSAGAKYGMEGVTDVTSTTQLIAACDVPVAPPVHTYSMAPPGSSLFNCCRAPT